MRRGQNIKIKKINNSRLRKLPPFASSRMGPMGDSLVDSRRSSKVAPISTLQLHRAFKSSGLTLQKDVLKHLQSLLAHESQPLESLQSIIKALKRSLKRPAVHLNDLEDAVLMLTRNSADESEEAVELLSPFDQRVAPNPSDPHAANARNHPSKQLQVQSSGALHPPSSRKFDMYAQRFAKVKSRVLSNEFFTSKSASFSSKNAINLCSIGSLLGLAPYTKVFVIGFVTKDGMEDDTGVAHCNWGDKETEGYITETSIVLVEGENHLESAENPNRGSSNPKPSNCK